jgi:enoyl-CoA hydratase/carnithine racemase
VKDYADVIAGNAPLTVGSVKFIVGEAVKDESKRDHKAMSQSVKRCFASKDYVEGRTAFMEKRKPVFTGA